MSGYIKQFLFRGMFGIFIGSFIGHTIYLMMAIQNNGLELSTSVIITNYIATALIGFWSNGISVVFNIDEWSILRQTITHAILLLPYLPLANYLGWMPPTTIGKVLFVVFYVILYISIWFAFKTYYTKKARELNERINQLNHE